MCDKKIDRRPIKVKFIDMWWGDQPRYESDRIFKALSRYYDVVISDAADYVIDGAMGHEYTLPQYENCVKIICIGENYVPDFNFFDYAIGFDFLEFGDRFLRQPLFAFYKGLSGLYEMKRDQKIDAEALVRREFCSYVVTNGMGDPLRTEIFHRLSKYKRVASGGLYLNNVGGRVKDKNEFCARYKFNIAFENSVSPGYTTEKIMQPLSINVVPVYYGNPRIEEDFRPDCMVRINSRDDVERAVEEIIALDNDEEAYLKKVTTQCLVHPSEWYDDQLDKFLTNIIEQPLEQAKRTIPFGFQPVLRRRVRNLYKIDDMWKLPLRKVYSMFGGR